VIWDKKQVMVDINGAKQPLRFLEGFGDVCPMLFNTVYERFPEKKKYKEKMESKCNNVK